MNKITSFIIISFLLLPSLTYCAERADSSFYRSATIDGPTGLLTIPVAAVLDNGYYALAAHKYIFKINAGLLPGLELGLRINAEQFSDELTKTKRVVPHGKYNFISADQYPVNGGIGFYDQDIYLSFDKPLVTFYNIYITAGAKLKENGRWRALLGVSKITANTQFIFDKEGEGYNLGYRILISPKIRLEVGLLNLQHYRNLDFDNFTFGLNFSENFFTPKIEKWPWQKN